MDQHVETRVGPVPVRSVGNGPPVLAVHGLLLDGRLWDATARYLALHSPVLLPDLPLGSHRGAVPDRARLTPVHLAHALADLLDGLGTDRAVLVGNDTAERWRRSPRQPAPTGSPGSCSRAATRSSTSRRRCCVRCLGSCGCRG